MNNLNYLYNLMKQRIEDDYEIKDRNDNIMGLKSNLSYWSDELKNILFAIISILNNQHYAKKKKLLR